MTKLAKKILETIDCLPKKNKESLPDDLLEDREFESWKEWYKKQDHSKEEYIDWNTAMQEIGLKNFEKK